MPRPKKRPVPVLVLAILQLILGGLGLFCAVCSGAMTLSGSNAAMKQNQKRSEIQVQYEERLARAQSERLPLNRVMTTSSRVISWLCTSLLIAGGLGLLNMAPWGRWIGILYACLSIGSTLTNTVYEVFARGPVSREVIKQLGPAQNAEDEMLLRVLEFSSVGAYFIPLVLLVFPIITLVILNLKSTRKAFSAGV